MEWTINNVFVNKCEFCHCALAPDSVVQLQWDRVELNAFLGSLSPQTEQTRESTTLNSVASHNKSFISNSLSSLRMCSRPQLRRRLSSAHRNLLSVQLYWESAFSCDSKQNLLPSTGSIHGRTRIHLQKECINPPARPYQGSNGQSCHVREMQKSHICTEKLHLLNCKYKKTAEWMLGAMPTCFTSTLCSSTLFCPSTDNWGLNL